MAKLQQPAIAGPKMSWQGAVDRDLLQAGYDAFWLARFLKARGIECLVVDAARMQVNRRARRAKTDRIDVGMLLRALMAWGQGDRHVWSVVRVPNVDEEDFRRSHRERDRLVKGQLTSIASRACCSVKAFAAST